MSKVGQPVTMPESAYYSGAATEGPPNFGAMSDGVSQKIISYLFLKDHYYFYQV